MAEYTEQSCMAEYTENCWCFETSTELHEIEWLPTMLDWAIEAEGTTLSRGHNIKLHCVASCHIIA
eukprot:scaffold47464_cov22-Prasinocladus_malaysianus.AAC.1